MSLQSAPRFAFEFGGGRPIEVEISKAPLSSDAGLLVFRQLDERLRYTQQFAAAMRDTRVDPTHTRLEMLRQRVYGMLADYEDQNDHDTLRHDPIFKIIADRDPVDPKQDLASQPTLSRFENAVSIGDLWRLRSVFVDLFLQSWAAPRCTIVKVEVNSEGTNRRVVITNRPGGALLPGATYEEYVQRGESENRHKELKRELHGDRLSDHRFMANYFRLLMHALAYNLLVQQRRLIADPPAVGRELDEDVAPPAEALAGRRRRQYFNHRRERDVLGEGHITTWRTRIIKVAAEVVTSTRRIVLRLSSTWPHLALFEQVAKAVLSLAPV